MVDGERGSPREVDEGEDLFFFCLIILAFSLCKTMAANYKTKGSVAATHEGEE